MNVPVFVLAGQSNVGFLMPDIEDAFEDQFGLGNFHLVKVYNAGAPLTRMREAQLDWRDPEELREELTVETVNALLEDDDRTFGGMIWIHGEADTYTTDGANRYEGSLEGLIDGFRDDVSAALDGEDAGFDSAPVTILELSDHAPEAENRIGWDTVAESQRDVAQADPLVEILDPDTVAAKANLSTDELFRDGLHYADDFGALLAAELVQTLSDPADGMEGGDLPPTDEVIDDMPDDPASDPTPDTPDTPDEPLFPVVDVVLPDPDLEDPEPDPFEDDSGGLEGLFFVLPLLGLLAALG